MEAVMNNAGRLAGLLISTMILAVSCRQVFTESVGSSLARDTPPISSSASVNELLDIAQSRYAADSAVAGELLSILGDKDTATIDDLSDEEKSSILNLGGAAVLDITEITKLSQDIADNPGAQNALVEDALNRAEDTDTTVLEHLLADATVLQNCSPDSILLASVAIVANVTANGDSGDVMTYLSGGAAGSLTADQQGQLDLVGDTLIALESRPDVEDLEISGFDLLDLLRGTI